MADNIAIKDGNDVLAIVATEDIGGREFQLLKLGYGVSGTFNQITSSSPLPVNVENFPLVTSAYIINQTIPVIEVSSVNVTNFPLVQEVSGSLNIVNFPVITSAYIINPVIPDIEVSAVNITNTVAVSGTISATILNPSSSAVSVVNFPGTQNINGVVGISGTQTVTISNPVSSISVTNFPGTTSAYLLNQTPVVSSVNVLNFPVTTSAYIINQTSSTGFSAVSVTNFPSVQGVSGTISTGLVQGLTNSELRSSALNVSVGNSLSISSIPAITISNPVSSVNVTNFPTTTSAYIINQTSSTGFSAISITNFPGTQNVNGIVGVSGTHAVTVSNSISVSSIPSITISNPVSSVNVTNFPTIQSVSGTVSATITNFPSTQNSNITNQISVSSIPNISGTVNVGNSLSISSLPSVVISNPVSSVNVLNFPTTQSVSGIVGLSGNSLVTVSNNVSVSSIPNISGTVSVNNFPSNQNVTVGNSLSISSIPSITISNPLSSVSVTNFPASQNINGSVDVSSSVNISTTPVGELINYWPAMQQIPAGSAGLSIDPSGALQVRGAITSDEGSYSTDFPGNTPYQILSGTCIFTNGSSVVSGIGTSFLSQLSYGDCIRLSADSAAYFTRVVQINSDTLVTLEYGYLGTGGTGGTYFFGFEHIKEGTSNISVSNSNIILDSGLSATSLVQISRVVDFLPTAAILRGFWFNQNIPQVDPYFGFFDSDDIRTSNVAAYVQFATYQTAQLITRTSLSTYDTNTVTFNLPGNATVDIPARWRLEVTDDKVSVYYNEISVAISYNHLPPIYKSLNFNMGIYNVAVPPTNTLVYCDEVLFKNVDVINTASSLLTHVQASYDSTAAALLGELTSTINILQATLKSFASIAGMSVNTLGQQRISVDNIAGSLTLGTITTVSTVTTVTGVTTVSTLSNQTNIGSYGANDMVPATINNNAIFLRQLGVVVS